MPRLILTGIEQQHWPPLKTCTHRTYGSQRYNTCISERGVWYPYAGRHGIGYMRYVGPLKVEYLTTPTSDARSADLGFGAKSEPLHDERHPAGVAYPCCLAARLNSLIRRGHRRFSHCDFRGTHWED